jgi:hypothetical protein
MKVVKHVNVNINQWVTRIWGKSQPVPTDFIASQWSSQTVKLWIDLNHSNCIKMHQHTCATSIKCSIARKDDQLHWICEVWDSVPSGTKSAYLIPMHSIIHRSDCRSSTIEQLPMRRRRWRSCLIGRTRYRSPAVLIGRISANYWLRSQWNAIARLLAHKHEYWRAWVNLEENRTFVINHFLKEITNASRPFISWWVNLITDPTAHIK